MGERGHLATGESHARRLILERCRTTPYTNEVTFLQFTQHYFLLCPYLLTLRQRRSLPRRRRQRPRLPLAAGSTRDALDFRGVRVSMAHSEG